MPPNKTICCALFLLALAACGPAPTAAPATAVRPSVPAPTPAPATAPPTAAASAAPGRAGTPVSTVAAAAPLVTLAGNSFATSDPFTLAAATTLDVRWAYTGTAPFALWLVNMSQDVTDPNFDRILVDDVSGPHAGSAQAPVIAGDWALQVEQAAGPWTVEIRRQP